MVIHGHWVIWSRPGSGMSVYAISAETLMVGRTVAQYQQNFKQSSYLCFKNLKYKQPKILFLFQHKKRLIRELFLVSADF